MSLAPLLTALPAIQIHAFAALAAFALGLVQLSLPKGTGFHRRLGWLWVGLMAATALSSFWIHTICMMGSFSPIHLLSVLTLAGLPVAVGHARNHRITSHKHAMTTLFFLALVIAGLFTFLPGRIMHDVAFGTATARGTCV
jgi:uncharacterized membrane protein